jgi:glutathione S-transferase
LQVPLLELDDGTKLTQSAAISMYCAGEAGMLPTDPFEVARTVELMNTLEDVRCFQSAWGHHILFILFSYDYTVLHGTLYLHISFSLAI